MQTDEYRLIQNPAIGALCIWAFVREFWIQSKKERGPSIVLVFTILPIAFHRESVESLHSRRFDGGLLNALADDRSLMIGLQERMEQMCEQTFEALRIAIDSQLLILEPGSLQIAPNRLTPPDIQQSNAHREMLATCARLGYWFASLPLEQICNYLRIRF